MGLFEIRQAVQQTLRTSWLLSVQDKKDLEAS
jgi:hypothetical protein